MSGRRPPILLRLALTFAALAWAALIVVAPAWEAAAAAGVRRSPSLAASIVRLAGAQVCHQRPERSFHLRGRPLAVCGRCTGLYVSGALGLLAVSARRRRIPSAGPRLDASPPWWPNRLDGRTRWLATAAAPTMLTWTAEVAGMWNPGTPLRALAALPLGLVTGWLVGHAMDA